MSRYFLGHRAFKTKDAARVEIRRILHAAEIDRPLIDGEASLIAALYAQHPRRSGTPDAICVGINDYHGTKTRGFHAIYADRREAFSYIPCLNPGVDDPNLLKALRASLMLSQREAMRAAYHGRAFLKCGLSLPNVCRGPVPLASAHVHHLPPKFRDIADAFVGLVGLPSVVTGDIGDDFSEPETKHRWVRFHDAVAQRVIVCAPCNAADERA
jgi:hypothetical protein